jgi:hypothetical protein
MVDREIFGATESAVPAKAGSRVPDRKPWATPHVIVSIAGERTQKALPALTDKTVASGYNMVLHEGS